MKLQQSSLPTELTRLVNQLLDLLGRAIKEEYGLSIYRDVENVRSLYKKVRNASIPKRVEVHQKVTQQLAKKSSSDKFQMAHSFTISLELINACENAYRSYRLKQKGIADTIQNIDPIIFVLTAHPTEARSAESIQFLTQITTTLIRHLENPKEKDWDHLFHLILLLIKIPMSKLKSPTVSDEAEYIYSVLFKKDNILKLCEYSERGQPIFIRTWVGGDKDGHPGVDAKAMLSSLSLSRKKIISIMKESLHSCNKNLTLIKSDKKDYLDLAHRLISLHRQLKVLSVIKPGDGRRLSAFQKILSQSLRSYKKAIGVSSPDLLEIQSVFKLFPGMVVPLELREDSQVISEAQTAPSLAIVKMIKQLKSISSGGQPVWYVRGLVVSMCESPEDLKNAAQLLKNYLGDLYIPVIPLFETRYALSHSSEITKKSLNIQLIKGAIGKFWDKKFEVMLGYSDSAKESGAFFSRVIIQKTLDHLDRVIRQSGMIPIFFHGSGGSVARGGGSIEEQISWWPLSARQRFKATIQGEMIYRSFATPEILNRQIEKIRTGVRHKNRPKKEILESIRSFADQVSQKYSEKIHDENFLEVVKMATPYPYLDQLKIGSRPSKRKKVFNLKSLRAIPWVLCWTQTRVLFPVWWGVGSSWKELSQKQQSLLKKAYRESDLFRSYIKLLAYTLAKVDLSIWNCYLENSPISKDRGEQVFKLFQKELNLTCQFLEHVTGKKNLLWYRPWLQQSIQLRSTMIYPLNILEIEALKTKDIPLLRETVTGIASGMLTTG